MNTHTQVAAHTHFMPEQWWGKTHTSEVRGQLLSMFKYKAQLFLEELLSVLFAPVILCLSMPGCAQEIVDFVTEHTVDVEGVGSVCSYSLFDFGRCVCVFACVCVVCIELRIVCFRNMMAWMGMFVSQVSSVFLLLSLFNPFGTTAP